MKNTLRKTLSLFLAFTLLCSLGLTAAASEAMGEDLTSKGTLLNQKTQLSTNVFWSTAYSDLRTENVVTYEPNADVTPIVTFGDSLTTRTTVTSAARALESQGYRVVAGINGDFFNTSNGLPIGILVSEGEVLSSDGGFGAGAYTSQWRAVKSTVIDRSTYNALHMWVYGDGSGNILSLLCSNGTKGYLTGGSVTLDFTGWKQVTFANLGDWYEILGLQVSVPATAAGEGLVYADTPRTGTIYIDHITATASGTPDNAAPVVSASLDNSLWQVTASVADAVDGILPAGSVTVTYNGAPYGSYDPATGLVTVALPGPGESHEAMRITITARDLSGNIGRASVDVEPYGVDHKFTDINDYWAATYVDFLYNANITTGYADGTFRPNDNISRQQFAVMLYRYLGLDGTQYESVTLPFADNASIGDYALTAVKALYTEGIINGSTGSDGRLYFNPGGSLTRAQAAAMIGRTQEKGYAIVELTFSDTASIPAYATYSIQTMAAQGVISGYADGTFQPGANITRGQMAKILYNLM